MIKITKENSIQVLNVGTKILLADVMDQYLRSLGDVKTYYVSKQSNAVQNFNEKKPQVIFCEYAFQDGGAIEFIEKIGGLGASRDLYFVLAVEESKDDLVSLAIEKGIDEILVKPFSTDNISQIIERYFEKKNIAAAAWAQKLRLGRVAFIEKRFQEADELYTQCAKENLENVAALIECAEYFLERKNHSLAQQISSRILERAPDNVRAMNCAGVALKRLGKLKDSVEQLQKANFFSPLNSVRHSELAEAYVLLAEEEIQSALKSESENGTLILAKARFQVLRKDYAGAVVYLDAKRSFMSDAVRKEADALSSIAKKFGGIK